MAGYAIYVKDGKPIYHYNWFDRERTVIESSVALPAASSTVIFDFAYDGGRAGMGGEGVLYLDGKEVGRKRIERTVPARFGIDTFGVGCDTGSPVSNDYKPPNAFSGTIRAVNIYLGDSGLSPDDERALHAKFKAGKDY